MRHIVPLTEEHIAGFHAAFDAVAREKLFLGRLEAPPIEETRKYVLDGIRDGMPRFVALSGGEVVGWCDVQRKHIPSMAHSGVLGMGVLAPHRGKGIGRALLAAALLAARERGMTRVELTVRTDNLRARKLYESFGFTVEGLCRAYMKVDGAEVDSYLMSLLA